MNISRQIPLLMAVVLLISGCSLREKVLDQQIIDDEREMPNSGHVNQDHITYDTFDSSTIGISEEEASRLFYDYESKAITRIYHCVEKYVMDKEMQDALHNAFDEEGNFDVTLVKSPQVEDVNQAIDNGFTFVLYQGVVYPTLDYRKLQVIGERFNEETQSYINLKAGELQTSQNFNLEDQLICAETHLKKYPKGKTQKDILEMYMSYLLDYMPLGEHHEENSIAHYKAFIKAHEDSLTAQILKEYMVYDEKEDVTEEDTSVYIDHLEKIIRDYALGS